MKKLFLILFLLTNLFSFDFIEFSKNIKDTNSTIDSNYQGFVQYIEELKEKRFEYNGLYKDEKTFLTFRVNTNRKAGHNKALQRDQIRLKDIELINSYYLFEFNILSISDTLDNQEIFDGLLTNIKNELQDIEKDSLLFIKFKRPSGEIEEEFNNNLDNYINNINVIKNILTILDSKKEMFYTQKFNIKELEKNIISHIESEHIQSLYLKINDVFKNMNISILSIIITILFIFISLLFFKYIIRKSINFIEYFITTSEKENVSFLNITFPKNRIDNFFYDALKRPIYLFLLYNLIFISLDLMFLDKNTIDISLRNSIFYVLIGFSFIHILNTTVIYFSDNFINKFKNVRKELIALFLTTVKIVVWFIVLMLVLKAYGKDLTVILSTLGFGGVALAFASKDTISNLLSGIKVVLEDTFSIGDWIVTDNIEGTVIEIRLMSTTIRTFANAVETIPNSVLANSVIRNWSRRKIGRRIKETIHIDINTPPKVIKNIVEEIKDMLYNNKEIKNSKRRDDNAFTKQKEAKIIQDLDYYGIKDTLLVNYLGASEQSKDIQVYCFSKTIQWDEWLNIRQQVLLDIEEIIINNGTTLAIPYQKIKVERTI
jgi:MscS family membrane protein